MRRLLCTAFLAIVMSVGAEAALVTFDFGPLSGAAGDPLNLSQAESSMGVNYTANLQLDGSATILVNNNGLAVAGGTFEINANESIMFNMAAPTAVSGGTATFNGFHSVSFTEFDTGDTALVNGSIIDSSNSNVPLLLAGASSFTALGTGDAGVGSAGFQISQVVADFTIVPTAVGVPEPSSLAALLLIGVAVNRRRRRN